MGGAGGLFSLSLLTCGAGLFFRTFGCLTCGADLSAGLGLALFGLTVAAGAGRVVGTGGRRLWQGRGAPRSD